VGLAARGVRAPKTAGPLTGRLVRTPPFNTTTRTHRSNFDDLVAELRECYSSNTHNCGDVSTVDAAVCAMISQCPLGHTRSRRIRLMASRARTSAADDP
jgi:hypothetical protein